MALKPSDILALSKAGYNSAQIALIAQGIQAEAAAPAPAEKPDPAPTKQAAEHAPAPAQQAAEPAPAPAPAPAPVPSYDGIMAELQKISGAMFAGNIANSQQPREQTPEDIIAAIIRPPQPVDNK